MVKPLRMARRALIAACICLAAWSGAMAQISPGELVRAHEQLEGVSNCTKCHDIGKTISSAKCMDCHKEIASRVAAKSGYHYTVRDQQCITCHKDHHGKDFAIVRFDSTSFDHKEAGFVLEGKHASTACRLCHTPSKISVAEAASFNDTRKKHTYLGLLQTCSSCHKDVHAGEFSQTCQSCHDTKSWKPAPKFSHTSAKFQLTGKHATVACKQCHTAQPEGAATVHFTVANFSACSDCHTDPHAGKFKQTCETCHSTEDWHQGATKHFDHAATRFPLLGLHASVKCESCHHGKTSTAGTSSFIIAKFNLCSDCHTDAHGGQFTANGHEERCERCHVVTSPFTLATYSQNDHDLARFTLTGAHSAIPCDKCHQSGSVTAKDSRMYHWTALPRCTSCHNDIHKGQFSDLMTAGKGCETCHSTAAWDTLAFDHNKTTFPLSGKHATTGCEQCHKQINAGTPAAYVQYKGTSVICSDCHHDEHEGQFAAAGVTNCAKCHTATSWHALSFDHSRMSRFDLRGKHMNIACAACHKKQEMNGRMVVTYKPLGTQCEDCHTQ